MDYTAARQNMVESQVRPNQVTDKKLLDAMRGLPREAFVPTEFLGVAYVDDPVPLGEGRYLMPPLAMARLIQEAAPAPSDLALVVGSATGYSAAVLSHMVGAVVALESDSAMATEAAQTLTELGIDTVAVVEGALAEGHPAQAPYDVIYFDGAVPEVPESISSQLAEGGRLVAVVSDGGKGCGVLVSRHRGGLSSRDVFESSTRLLPGFEREKAFAF
ncbi:MAG: protein-L-isoaspartate O-methyltransferase [Alphaproteobacteria bacterium]|nr:protein-L-isoaspartate O-methyltransferase [Alphaproteobacteria bacterium]